MSPPTRLGFSRWRSLGVRTARANTKRPKAEGELLEAPLDALDHRVGRNVEPLGDVGGDVEGVTSCRGAGVVMKRMLADHQRRHVPGSGLLNVEEVAPDAFDHDDVILLSTLANQVSAALRAAALLQRVKQAEAVARRVQSPGAG
jgi:hypothetical protein